MRKFHFLSVSAIVVLLSAATIACSDDDKEDNAALKNNDNSQPSAYFSCPDDKHPHLIDLGLPSGTKWTCCNIGATSPENFGDYFLWDEFICKNMNKGYSLPTVTQYEELINNCEQEWTTINSIYGMKYIGTNDSYIFLPAAASYWLSDITNQYEINDEGTGYYWTCTASEYTDYYCIIEFPGEGVNGEPIARTRITDRDSGNKLPIRVVYNGNGNDE